ncbi:MAG TPA: aspartate carbamoyltransferase catalytic subunit [Phycisphaerae bacterium]|nr:aspartate carbamoyltransferase catalytic subunit [Phycisphaerae bacterium]HRR85732.1 aspartate carbamoyltransferase catalytic subunit [Phycisphaerae bacterium]
MKTDTRTAAAPAGAGPAPKPEPEFTWARRHLLGLEDLNREEILHIFRTAESLQDISTRSIKKVPSLRGRVVVNLFFENSTRTKTSFTLAAQRLSADVIDFTAASSSVAKGESLRDTVRNIEAMGVDTFIIRHTAAGAPHLITRCTQCHVINAGDGQHEHPTQGLIDIFTIRERKKRIEGLNVVIVGDIAHSRVARSNFWGLTRLGAHVTFCGPTTLVPQAFEKFGARVTHNLDEAIRDADVINMLRIQHERMTSSVFPSTQEYVRLFGLTSERVRHCKPDVLILHPGPINRGVELASDVADGPNSSILRQVSNGLAIRMAVLFLLNQTSEAAK